MRQAARLSLFGAPALEAAGVITPLSLRPRAYALLALLALGCDRPQTRSHLAARLWPVVPDEEARTNLRRHLHLIVHALPEDAGLFVLTKTSVQWNPDAAVRCDVVEFLRACREPERESEAAQLYAGELCAGVLDEALEPLRARLADKHDALLRNLASRALACGDTSAAVLALQQLVENNPLDETCARRLILARCDGGDRAGALREYHALEARLRAELDVEPEPQTCALLDRLLTPGEASATPTNLAGCNGSLVGRAAELRAIVNALETERVVTLTGSGGIGKTRLAIEAARTCLPRFRDGVWFVDLARERTAAAALDRIALVLEAPGGTDRLAALCSLFAEKTALLVLDNLEQLGADARGIVDALIARTRVRILATSRRRVAAVREHVVMVGALELPPLAPTKPELLTAYSGVRLFLERATKVAPQTRITFGNARSVAQIVRRLDGIPLAIELVASRANLLTIEGIAKRLEEHAAFAGTGREERHVTIDEAIAWSYNLLTETEQAVFRRIAVFADECSVEALEDVCATIAPDTVSPISELVEGSLLSASASEDAIRYRTFELTREFAGKKLHECGEYDQAAQRHAAHYVHVAERLCERFTTQDEQAAYAQCDRESANFDLALAWSMRNDQTIAARLVASLWRYWIFRGRAAMGESVIAGLERGAQWDRLPIDQRARVLQAAGMFARETHLQHALPYLERALALFRECADARGERESLYAIAAYNFGSQNYAASEREFTACLALQEACGDSRGAAGTLANLAQLAWIREDCGEALSILHRALDVFQATNNARGVAHVFRTRSSIFGTLGRHEEAVAQAEQSVALYEELGEPVRIAEALSGLCDQLVWAGRVGDGFTAARRSLEMLTELRNVMFLCNAVRSLHFAAFRAGEYQDVLRIDTMLRRLEPSIGLGTGRIDGTTDYALEYAKAALPPLTAEAAIMAASAMDDKQLLVIARKLEARHRGLVIEAFTADNLRATA